MSSFPRFAVVLASFTAVALLACNRGDVSCEATSDSFALSTAQGLTRSDDAPTSDAATTDAATTDAATTDGGADAAVDPNAYGEALKQCKTLKCGPGEGCVVVSAVPGDLRVACAPQGC